MKRILAFGSAALLTLAIAGPVAADAGGVPNENADCHAQLKAIVDGSTQEKADLFFGGDVKALQTWLKGCR